MKSSVAVIADIHGNLPAFLAIEKDLQKRGIKDVMIAGDIISDCPDSDQVLTKIRQSSWTVIKGNREQYFLDHRAGLLDHWTHARQMSALMWTFDRLSRKNVKYIESLKPQMTVKIGQLSVKIVHGSAHSLTELIYPVKKRERFIQLMDELEEDMMICGHSHFQWFHEYNGKWALNPGSAGVHFNKEMAAEYAIIHVDEKEVEAELVKIPYSIEELEERFHKSGLYEASPHWSRSVLDSIRKGENISLQMIDYALKMMENEGITEALTIPDHIWDRAGEEYLNRR